MIKGYLVTNIVTRWSSNVKVKQSVMVLLNVFSTTKSERKHNQLFINYLANDSVISNSIAPLAWPIGSQSFPFFSRIGQTIDMFIKILYNYSRNIFIQFSQLFLNLRRQDNLISQFRAPSPFLRELSVVSHFPSPLNTLDRPTHQHEYHTHLQGLQGSMCGWVQIGWPPSNLAMACMKVLSDSETFNVIVAIFFYLFHR